MRPAVRVGASAVRPFVITADRLRPVRGLTIIGWHRVDGDGNGLSTGVADFRRHLDVLEEWGATVLPLDDAVRALDAGTLPPRAVALTFDDGYASVVETAWPILRDRGLPATLFAVTGYLTGGRRFGWDAHEAEHDRHRLVSAAELRAAAEDGLDIGSHTVTHPWLPGLERDEVKHELVDSRACLEDLLERPITSLAYPTGGWNPLVRSVAAEAGYRCAITVDRGLNLARTPRLSLRRAFVPHAPEDLRLLLDGAYTWLRPFDAVRRRKGPTW